jgi:hypothetical protein
MTVTLDFREYAPRKRKGRREEVPAFPYYGSAGGGADHFPLERREEVPFFG